MTCDFSKTLKCTILNYAKRGGFLKSLPQHLNILKFEGLFIVLIQINLLFLHRYDTQKKCTFVYGILYPMIYMSTRYTRNLNPHTTGSIEY